MERSLDYFVERPLRMDIVGNEVSTRTCVKSDDLIRFQLRQQLVRAFNGYEETAGGRSLSRNVQKTLFAFAVRIAPGVRCFCNARVPHSLPKIGITYVCLAPRIGA